MCIKYYVPSAMLVFEGHKNERKKFCLHDTHSLAEDTPNAGISECSVYVCGRNT